MFTTSMNLKLRTAIVICSIGFAGGLMQIVFWKSENTTISEALLSHGYLWIAYFVVGVLVAEHILNLFRRRREKQTRAGKNQV